MEKGAGGGGERKGGSKGCTSLGNNTFSLIITRLLKTAEWNALPGSAERRKT